MGTNSCILLYLMIRILRKPLSRHFSLNYLFAYENGLDNGFHLFHLLDTIHPECLLGLLLLDEIIVCLACTLVSSLVGLHLLDILFQAVCTSAHGDILVACQSAKLDGLVVLTQDGVYISLLQIRLTLEFLVISYSLLILGECSSVLLALGETVGNIQANDTSLGIT